MSDRLRMPGGRGRRWGGALIEMALVMPLLLAVTLGGIEFGYFFYVKHNMQSAARDGARAGIVSGASNSDVTTAVARVLESAGLGSSDYSVLIENASTNASLSLGTTTAGTPVRVTVSCAWNKVGLRPLGFISISKQVSGSTVMRKE